MIFKWEVRETLRWGSKHVRFFASEEKAIEYAELRRGPDGSWKRVGDVIYYSRYPDED